MQAKPITVMIIIFYFFQMKFGKISFCLFVIVSSGAEMSQLICGKRPSTDVHPHSLPNLRKLLVVLFCNASIDVLYVPGCFSFCLLRCWDYILELLMRVTEISFMWILGIQTHVFVLE